MKRIFLFIAFAPMFLLSCGSNDDEAKNCYSFDLRSCAGDVWAKDSPGFDNTQDLLNTIEAYLENQGIKVLSISIDESFHEIVCLACYVCPQGSRVYISTSDDNKAKLTALDLLSFSTADCATVR